MGAVPKKKITKARKGKRRASISLVSKNIQECPQCHNQKLSHQACPECGYYRPITK